MKELPDSIKRFLLGMGLLPEELLILSLDNAGKVVQVHDALKKAPEGLEAGCYSEDVFPFLTGLFPLEKRILQLSNIETQKDIFSNVYMLKDQGTVWVFIKDISDDMVHMSNLIQEHNENLFWASSHNLLQKAREKSLDNERIIKESEELKKLLHFRNQFVSIISHDLRSPLITLIGLSDLLINDPEFIKKLTEEEKEYIEHIDLELRRTIDYLEKLYGWTRLSTGRFELNIRKANLKNMVNSSYAIFKSRLKSKNITFITLISDSLEIFADETFFIQLLNNIIGNAIKFTPKSGRITISATGTDHSVILKIEDNGVGIPDSIIQKIHAGNQTVSTYGTQGEKGAGIGLIICRIITESHKFGFIINSVVHEGTTVSITIPIKNLKPE